VTIPGLSLKGSETRKKKGTWGETKKTITREQPFSADGGGWKNGKTKNSIMSSSDGKGGHNKKVGQTVGKRNRRVGLVAIIVARKKRQSKRKNNSCGKKVEKGREKKKKKKKVW